MKFGRALFLIAVVAFGVRVAYVAFAKSETCSVRAGSGELVGTYPSECAVGDQLWYNSEANAVADGDGFVEPLWEVDHPGEDPPPAADHPPLTSSCSRPCRGSSNIRWRSSRATTSTANVREHRYTMVLLGTLLVVLIGLLGRRVGGDATGLVAAGIAAVTPEHLGERRARHVGDVTGVRRRRRAVARRDRRGNATDAVDHRRARRGVRAGRTGARRAAAVRPAPRGPDRAAESPTWCNGVLTAVGAAVIVVAPWVVYNLTRFEERTFVSTNDGVALAGSNCDPVYHGAGIGLTSFEPTVPRRHVPPPGDQSEVAKVYRNRAREYVEDNLDRAPSSRSPASVAPGACTARSTWSSSTRARGASRG